MADESERLQLLKRMALRQRPDLLEAQGLTPSSDKEEAQYNKDLPGAVAQSVSIPAKNLKGLSDLILKKEAKPAIEMEAKDLASAKSMDEEASKELLKRLGARLEDTVHPDFTSTDPINRLRMADHLRRGLKEKFNPSSTDKTFIETSNALEAQQDKFKKILELLKK